MDDIFLIIFNVMIYHMALQRVIIINISKPAVKPLCSYYKTNQEAKKMEYCRKMQLFCFMVNFIITILRRDFLKHLIHVTKYQPFHGTKKIGVVEV